MFCRQSTVPRCLKFIPISCMGSKHAPKDTNFISTNLYALEHVHVVQIGIMHINALKTQLMHKNVQTNPEKPQKTMPLHDSMPSFMNFRRVLDLLEFKNQASQCFASNQRCSGV